MSKELGENIKLYRQKQKLTREALSNKLDISIHTLAKYEQGQREPNIEMLEKIAKHLKINVSDLLGETLTEKVNKENWLKFSDDQIIDLLKPIGLKEEVFKTISENEKNDFLNSLAKLTPFKVKIQNYLNNFDKFKKEDLIELCNDITEHYKSLIENIIDTEYKDLYDNFMESLNVIGEQRKYINDLQKFIDKSNKIINEQQNSLNTISKILNDHKNLTSKKNK